MGVSKVIENKKDELFQKLIFFCFYIDKSLRDMVYYNKRC